MSHCKPLVIRADAGAQIGMGHVMRCLALAQAWQEVEGPAIFVTCPGVSALEERLRAEGIEAVHQSFPIGGFEDVKRTVTVTHLTGADWVVVDGYRFNAEYLKQLKNAGLRILLLDDNGGGDHYYADIILNQNIHANEKLYLNREPYTQLLLGSRYILLRKEFWRWWRWQRDISQRARKVLVTLGGGDCYGVTIKVLQALQEISNHDLEIVILVGTLNPHQEEVRFAIEDICFPIRVEYCASDMPNLLKWADIAISAGGSTCWELAFMGLPALTIVLADNQRPVATALAQAGIVKNLGWHENLSHKDIVDALLPLLSDAALRTQMSRLGQRFIDDQGVKRVLLHLQDKAIKLRRSNIDDSRLLWEWANEPEARALSFSTDIIPWEQHLQWLNAKLAAQDCVLFIAVDKHDNPIGQIRYELQAKAAVISISVADSYRGKGFGTRMIHLADQELFDSSSVNVIHAYVKENNEPSIRVFTRAGYENLGLQIVQGHSAYHFVRRK